MPMHSAFILLGSNQGNRKQYLRKAMEQIQQDCGRLVSESSIYETAAWGNTNQAAFFNQVICIKTKLSPDELMQQLLQIELNLGRVRTEKFGPRTIDLDLLFYDALIFHSKVVTVPHPAIQDRKFVLIPLTELSPGKIHPVYKKTIRTLLKECTDQLAVTKLTT
jgi:2-amino-4-hydroxy-6-hydroxymethyldihydropteridine diphosphokinase